MIKNNMTTARRKTRCAGVWSKMLCTTVLLGAATTMAYGQTPTKPNSDTTHVQRLEKVIISNTRADNKTPLTTSTVTKSELQDARGSVSLPFMLETLPSVVASGENGAIGGTYIRIRGVDASRINVNINGITLNDPESQSVFWYNIPNLGGMAQSLQIQRGVGASTGGSAAFGAAINMQTLNARSSAYGEVDFGLGSWNTRQYSLSAGTGIMKNGLSFDFAYSGLTSDGFVRSWGTDQQSFFGSISYYSNRTLVKLLTIIGSQTTGITWNGAEAEQLDEDPTFNSAGMYEMDGQTMYYPNETDNYWQRHYQLYVSHLLTDHWSLKGALDFTHGDGYYEQYMTAFSGYAPPPFDGVSDVVLRKMMDNNAITANVAANYKGSKLSFAVGDNFLRYDGDQFGRVIWVRDTSLGFTLPYEWYNNNSVKLDNSVFVKATYDFNDNFNVYTDLQLRIIDHHLQGNNDDVITNTPQQGPYDITKQYTFFNPKVGLNYRLSDRNRLYFVAGISNREPVRFDIMSAYANGTEIKPETMLDFELGYHHVATRWAFTANGYAMLYRDQLTPNGDVLTGYALMENVDKSYRIGIELEGGYKFYDWFRMDANLTLSRNKVIDNTYSDFVTGDTVTTLVTANTDLALSPSVVGAAIATFVPCKNAKVQLIGKYVGKQYADNTGREVYAIDPYFLLNIRAGYTWHLKGSNEIEAQLLVNNLLDHNYRLSAWVGDWEGWDDVANVPNYNHSQAYLQQPGRNFMARLIYRF